MAKISAEAINVYGAKIIYEHLSAMQAEVQGVLTSEDIEYVHRMRVATRRLRSSLAIFSDSFPKKDYRQFLKDIRAVTKALGAARDLDVQLELLEQLHPQFADPKLAPGVNRLQLRLKQHRQDAQNQVIKAMKTLEDDETLRRIARWAAPWLEKAENIYLYSPALFERLFPALRLVYKKRWNLTNPFELKRTWRSCMPCESVQNICATPWRFLRACMARKSNP